MNHLEIEYKTLLNKDEFHILLALFSNELPFLQTNYYIDSTDKQIKEARMSLRIRILENKAEMTLKIPQDVGNLEYNQELDYATAKQLAHEFHLPEGKIADYLNKNGVNPANLKVWGQLTTKRYELKSSIGLLALDENHYDNQLDYELELEVSDALQGQKDFEEFLRTHSVQFKYAKSKVARLATSLASDN